MNEGGYSYFGTSKQEESEGEKILRFENERMIQVYVR